MIGCGAIARQYLDTARRLDAIEIVAAADRVPARATAVEAAEGIPAMSVADLLANAEVDVVLNLTIPAAHAAIALQAIAAGKAVYGEKPDQRVFIRGDKAINYGRMMEVMGVVIDSGFRQLGLLGEQATGAPAGTSAPAGKPATPAPAPAPRR